MTRPRFIAHSPRQVARKIVRAPLRCVTAGSLAIYRELFDRDVKTLSAREEWRIVPFKRRTRRRRRSSSSTKRCPQEPSPFALVVVRLLTTTEAVSCTSIASMRTGISRSSASR